MTPITAALRKDLKARAHHIKPVVQIGQKGLTGTLVAAVDKALEDHELIKIKFIEYKEEKNEISSKLSEETHSEIVDFIGNVVIFYRQNEEE